MRFSYIIILLLSSMTVFSQKNITEEEFKELEEKSRAQINGNIDSSFYYTNKIEKSNRKEHLAFAKGIKSYLYQLKGDTLISNENYIKAFEFINECKLSNEKIRIETLLYNYGGLINWKRGKYNNALDLFNKGKNISESINDKAQIIKFNSNISLVYSEIEKYDLAIAISKKSDSLVDLMKTKTYTIGYYNNKSNINLNLGNYYFIKFKLNREDIIALDSAEHYFKKVIIFSENLLLNKINAKISLASIYYLKGDLKKAENSYLSTLKTVRENKLESSFPNLIYNLGVFYFFVKKNELALVYFRELDSIYLSNKYISKLDYLQSNYFQSLIFNEQDNSEKAIYHSNIFLKIIEEYKTNIVNESNTINSKLEYETAKKEVLSLKNKNKKRVLISNSIKYGIIITVLFLMIYIYFIKNEKKKIDQKISELLKQHDQRNVNKFKTSIQRSISNTSNVNLDLEKEILEKLQILIDKKYFLSSDFNQQNVAKKTKTNTTYLSYVVNNNFNKSFSEYANELKLNYVIDEIIKNPTYRKYSTQAIAESVGFKSAISFTKSFKKRVGITPTQFISKIENSFKG